MNSNDQRPSIGASLVQGAPGAPASKSSASELAAGAATRQCAAERFEEGILYGWAYDSAKPDERIAVSAMVGESLLGRGVADVFRRDLVKARIGDGHHGFQIVVDRPVVFDGATVDLVDESGRRMSMSRRLVVSNPANEIRAELHRLRFYSLVSIIVAAQPLQDATLRLRGRDGAIIKELRVDLQAGENRIEVALPAALFDDNEHLLYFTLAGYPHRLGAGIFRLRPVVTPWEHLSRRFSESGVTKLATHAARRYESLSSQLRAFAHGGSPTALLDVQRAHDVVVEGFERRTSYPTLRLPLHPNPRVSIVIPAHNHAALNFHCIASIILAPTTASFEVILVDDCSTDRTGTFETVVENLRVLQNATNLGFLRSCNAAVATARGEFVVLLNNDTEVTAGWLDELLLAFDDPSVGLAGSKLLNVDGTLQEAGVVVWKSGAPWNVGNGNNPMNPDFNYRRDVDAVSGASLCLRKSVWDEVGGFSPEFAPAYYEDTDLAFKVRAAGKRVVYVPTSEVVHFEGRSNGRDLTKGIKRFQVVNEAAFRDKWFHEFHKHRPEGEQVHFEKDRNIVHRILAIDYTAPDASQDAGGYAAIQEMKLLASLGCKVTFVADNLAHLGAATIDLQRNGVEVLYAPFYTSMDDVFQRRLSEFDAIYITRFDIAERYVPMIRSRTNAKIIFNNADLHFLRMLRSHSQHGEPSLEKVVDVRTRELAVMREVDAILSYNDAEHAVILSHNLRSDNIFHCPWVLGARPRGPAFEGRQGIAFLGGYRHTPNVDAMKWFVSDVMPLLTQQVPGLVLHIYGSNVTDEILALASDSVKVEGFVENLDDVFHRHRVFVAPLLSGAGIKGKVLEAMAYGTPSVLSAIAAEGTGLTNEVSALIAASPVDWARAVARLYNDPKLWSEVAERALSIAERTYSFAAGQEHMGKVMTYVGIRPVRSAVP